MKMKLSKEQVLKALQNAAAEAVEAAKSEIHLITEQVNLGLNENDVSKVQQTVDLQARITVDLETMKITSKGGYGAKTANLKKWGNEIEMEIDNPNQPPVCGGCGKDGCDFCKPESSREEPPAPEEVGD